MNAQNKIVFRVIMGVCFLIGFLRYLVGGDYLLSVLMLVVASMLFYKAKTGD